MNRDKKYFIIIAGQFYGGSTLLMRMLNAFPGVRICGENRLALLHLMQFYGWMKKSISIGHDQRHYIQAAVKPSWYNPMTRQQLADAVSNMIHSLFRRSNERIYGFKEIRMGCDFDSECRTYRSMSDFILDMKEVLPHLRIVFLTRRRDFRLKKEMQYILKHRKTSVSEYHRQIDAYVRFQQEHPEWCRLLDYADVAALNPKMKNLMKFLGLPFDLRLCRKILDKKL